MQIDKHVNMVGHAVACKYLTARMMFPDDAPGANPGLSHGCRRNLGSVKTPVRRASCSGGPLHPVNR